MPMIMLSRSLPRFMRFLTSGLYGRPWKTCPVRCLSVGDSASMVKTFTEEEVEMFAEISGDRNPIHFDHDYAAGTRYERPIVHGVLTVGLLSAVMGMQCPGPGAIVLSLDVRFPSALHIDEEVEAEVEAVRVVGRRAVLQLTCRKTSDREEVVRGHAKLLLETDQEEEEEEEED